MAGSVYRIFMEYVAGGTLHDLCNPVSGFTTVPEKMVREFTRQLLYAIKYLHDRNVIHRDIKPGNVLVSEMCQLKLCDFGHASVLEANGLANDNMIRGTPLFTVRGQKKINFFSGTRSDAKRKQHRKAK